MDNSVSTIIKQENKTRLCSMYRVLLHNDDVNEMDHVVNALQETFRFEIAKAVMVMKEAHEGGVALCSIEPLEHAEFHKEKLQTFGITVSIEPDV